jgi:hypothetical protein
MEVKGKFVQPHTMKAYIRGVEVQLLSFSTFVLDRCIYLYTYIPWIIRDKPHLDIGIVNIDYSYNLDMDVTTQCTYNMGTIMV